MAEWWEGGQGYPIGPIDNPYNNYGLTSTGVGNDFANARQRMTSNDAYRGTFPGQRSPHTGFEEMEFDETVQAPENRGIIDTIKGWTTPTLDFLKKIGGQRSPEKQAFYDAMGGSSIPSGRFAEGTYGGKNYELYNSPTSGLKVGSDIIGYGQGFEKNLDSAFGSKSIEEMEQKKLDWAEKRFNKLGRRGLGTRIYNELVKSGRISDRPTIDLTTFTDKINVPAATTTGGGARHDYERDRGGGYTLGGGFTGTRGQVGRTGSSAGEGRGHHSWRAEGGRIGYQDGELVEDESMFAATPRGMMEENIEEVQGEPTREQLEAIALEIFRLPLEQLNEEQLEVVYQAAMEQEPSEEEVQFAAQEGPGEGIASLV